MASDKVAGIGTGALLRQTILVTQSREGVGAGVDIAGFPVTHRPIHRSEKQEHQGHQIHETPRGILAVCLVVIPHLLKKGRRLKAGIFGHGGVQLPEEGRGDRVALAVNGVIPLHVPGGDGAAISLPDPQGTLAEELIGAGVEHLTHGRVGDVLPEGDLPVAFLLVHGLGCHCILHAATSFLTLR